MDDVPGHGVEMFDTLQSPSAPLYQELIEHSIFTHFTIPETRTEYSTVFAEHSLYITVGGLALVRGGGGGAVLTYN